MIMDYEKKYKETLEKARQLCDYPTSKPFISDLQDLFPELKESEDERIRNFLIKQANSVLESITDDDEEVPAWKSALSWLEKQGEQKTATIDIDKMVSDYANNKERGNEEFGKPVNCMIRAYRQGLIDAIGKVVLKPAWSEEDKKMSIFIGNAITADDASTYLESKGIQVIDAHVWLNGLKDKVQPKQEWSEEDRSKIQRICKYLNEAKKYYADITEVRECIDWLKSLRPQSTWKPSVEHMNALDSTLQYSQVSHNSFEHLNSLFNDLKKLREE